MVVWKFVGLVAVGASVAGCADDDAGEDATTSRDQTDQAKSHLSDSGGMGQDLPAPMPDGPWNDGSWKPVQPTVPTADPDQLDDLGKGWCAYGHQKIYDPGRGRSIEVPLVYCQ